MKSSSNFEHVKVKNRRPLFTNSEDNPHHARVAGSGVSQPERKRSRFNDSVFSNVQSKNSAKVKGIYSLTAKGSDKSIAPSKKESKQQPVCTQNDCPGPGFQVLLDNENQKKDIFDGPLNIMRKKCNKRTCISNLNKIDSDSKVTDILDDKSLRLLSVHSDHSSTNMKNDISKTDMSSQDSFTDMFGSPAASEIASFQNDRNLKRRGNLFSEFFEDDSQLAELDMSGIISSYNSVNSNMENASLHSDSSKVEINKTDCTASDNYSKSLHGKVNYLCNGINNLDTSKLSHMEKDTKIMGMLDDNEVLDNAQQQVQHNMNADDTNKQLHNSPTTMDTSEELFYGLSPHVESLIKKHKGIEKLYDWQNDCLNLPAVKKRQNLIYSLPTSGGKTLVAEILIMKELLCHQKDALLILPFVSIVQEKVRDMSLFAVDLEFLVEEYAASKGKFPPRKRRKKKSLYIATIEKANGLVNSLIEENRLSELGIIVIDELHMIGEGGHRGATLEMCLAKILFCSSATQIIGMSATLNNIADLQRFLNAEKYINNFRPVELKEYVKVENEIYEVKNDKIGRNEVIPLKRSRKIKHQSNDPSLLKNDPDHLSVLVGEVIPKYSCLLFCPTKQNCQNVAKLLAKTLSGKLKLVKYKEKRELLRSLKNNADGLCPVLREVIPYGIAYHHGGLTMDERKLIEEAYSQGTLCVLTCTSTLAAGVNLPAKRVILRNPYVGKNLISRSQYKQMIGRAGRAGIDTSGESILLMEKRDKEKVMNLINAPLESCYSSLFHSNGQGLRSLILSLIGLKVCNSMEDLSCFTSKTLLAVQNESQKNHTLLEKVQENVEALVKLKLVKKWDDEATTRVEATPLGRASFKGCVDVDRSPFIYDEIKRAQENLVLANDLHLLYLVTTPDMITDIKPHWMTYLEQVSNFNSAEQKACEFIGVSESYLCKQVSCNGTKKSEQEMAVVRRFYLTLMLYKIINEHSIWDVAETFKQPRGFIQSLFTSSTSFASCLVHFTEELPEFQNIKLLLETIVDKLSYTAVLELVPLMQIPGVKKNRAKQLFAAGYRNLQAVANAVPETLMKEIEYLHKTQATLLVSSAKMLLLEKAEALQEEVAELIGT